MHEWQNRHNFFEKPYTTIKLRLPTLFWSNINKKDVCLSQSTVGGSEKVVCTVDAKTVGLVRCSKWCIFALWRICTVYATFFSSTDEQFCSRCFVTCLPMCQSRANWSRHCHECKPDLDAECYRRLQIYRSDNVGQRFLLKEMGLFSCGRQNRIISIAAASCLIVWRWTERLEDWTGRLKTRDLTSRDHRNCGGWHRETGQLGTISQGWTSRDLLFHCASRSSIQVNICCREYYISCASVVCV